MHVESLINLAPPVRDIIVRGLSLKELNALEIALGKGRVVWNTYKSNFEALQKQITLSKQNLILQEILTDHPAWKYQIADWKVSLEDKVWLLQLYELRNLGVEIPQIFELIPSKSSPYLLKPNVKAAIITALNNVTTLTVNAPFSHNPLKKCPKAIFLLVNLKQLLINDQELVRPPNISKFSKLEWLNLNGNRLETPPDVSRNVNLKWIDLAYNPHLRTAPDINKNVNLLRLNVIGNRHLEDLDFKSLQNKNLRVLTKAL